MKLTITIADVDKINKLAQTNESVASALEQLLTVYALAHKPEIVVESNDNDFWETIAYY